MIKALAHPSRLLILEAISDQERCVQDLRDLIGADISTVSKHLAVMKKAGLVVSRKDGLKQYYRLCCGCLTDFFECVDQIVPDPPDA